MIEYKVIKCSQHEHMRILSVPAPRGGGGKRGTCPPEATASHTLPPEKKTKKKVKRHAKIGTSASLIPARSQSVKMVGH